MESVIARLRQHNISVEVVDGQLKLGVPRGVDTGELLDEVRQHKQELIRYVSRLQEGAKESARFDRAEVPLVTLKNESGNYGIEHQRKKEYIRSLIIGHFSCNLTFYIAFPNWNIEAMRRTLVTIIGRHENLRSALVTVDGDVLQHVYEGLPPGFEIRYVNLIDDEAREARIGELHREASAQPFDFFVAPAANFILVDYTSELGGLFVGLHHAITDKESMKLLEHEIRTVYEAYARGEENPLPPLDHQYKEYAHWVNRYTSGAKGKASQDYYMRHIRESLQRNGETATRSYRERLESDLRSFLKREDIESIAAYGSIVNLYPGWGSAYHVQLTGSRFLALKKLADACASTPFLTLAAAFALLFHRVQGVSSVRFYIPFSTRVFKEFESIVGWLTSEVIACVDVDESVSFRALVERTAATVLEASEHRLYPHERIMADLDLPLETLSPYFLNYIQSEGSLEAAPPLHVKEGSGHFPFRCTLHEYANGLDFRTDYNREIYTAMEIESMYDLFFRLLDRLSGNETLPLNTLTTGL